MVVRTAKWLAFLGDHGYEFALWLNNPLNWVRRHLGLGYWSLSAYLKHRVKTAVAFIGAFEEAVAAEARRRGADGVICGHIHHASDRHFLGTHYLNCGDWVESCTAIVETYAGDLRVIQWATSTTTTPCCLSWSSCQPCNLPQRERTRSARLYHCFVSDRRNERGSSGWKWIPSAPPAGEGRCRQRTRRHPLGRDQV